MRTTKIGCALVAVSLLLGGCSWTHPAAPGAAVRVATVADVGHCRKVGQTSVALYDKLAAIRDDPAKVRQALDALARDGAVPLGGDTVVPVGEVKEGRQRFDVYRCAPQ